MVHALGIDVNLVRSAVFGIGCGLAGAGGVLAAPLLTASIGMAAEMIIDAFVIVIIGGMGSFAASACPLCRSPEARICDRDREFESRFLQQRVERTPPSQNWQFRDAAWTAACATGDYPKAEQLWSGTARAVGST